MDVGGYYEAKVQVRPLDDGVISYIYDQVEKSKDCSIVKALRIQKGSGVDIYLTSWRFAVNLSRRLKKVFNGQIIITRSLYGRNRNTSKTVYRVTVLFRLIRKED
jgi:NMD protein affecting ribosome stability and mRNA decay